MALVACPPVGPVTNNKPVETVQGGIERKLGIWLALSNFGVGWSPVVRVLGLSSDSRRTRLKEEHHTVLR